jgi:hypothetical protein
MTNDIGKEMTAAWNSGNVQRIGERYATGAVMHHPLVPAPLEGRDAIVGFEGAMFAAFSELDWRCLSLVGTGRELALEFQVIARNTSPMQTPKGTVPATNRKITLRGVSLVTLDAEGRIVAERRYFDSGSLFAQLGLLG